MTTGLKTAAIWSRVSTKGQAEISLPTQVDHCQRLLKDKGYVAIKIFSIDHCSLDLSSSKEFQQLQQMIQAHEVDAVCCYDRDRLMADGIDRLVFLSQLRESGVELLICNGVPIMDSDEGQIVELALALGKKRSVLRARSGCRENGRGDYNRQPGCDSLLRILPEGIRHRRLLRRRSRYPRQKRY